MIADSNILDFMLPAHLWLRIFEKTQGETESSIEQRERAVTNSENSLGMSLYREAHISLHQLTLACRFESILLGYKALTQVSN